MSRPLPEVHESWVNHISGSRISKKQYLVVLNTMMWVDPNISYVQ